MGLALLLGSLLIAVGPSAIFFVITVSRRPYLLVVSLLGLLQGIVAFLVGGIVYSIWNIWTTPMPLVILILDILLVEILRPFVYKLIVLACNRLNEVEIPLSITVPSELYKLSLCVGMGIGFINVLTIALVPLTSAGANADYYIPTCQSIPIYILIAIEAFCIMPMHVVWTYLTMRDYSKHSIITPILICIWHIIEGVVVVSTEYNQQRVYLCTRVLPNLCYRVYPNDDSLCHHIL
ncbi:gammasecretase subunit Aph-1 [Blastocystis sp. subtype 4]|uniref:gammasecretase subunit Aph-1 n=1 Tax=Blastocystis sp. subtype 4 TaxID=944170 RepID=UPI0007120BF0|nr:gammasecretase subunit Aph-1 [Blastocystis sp. subtype 4]KNB43641.1 gammasecretase subunit Aph-1 [Blastocystis sp. subtype 4]|eukprot:XP_014527084.1 gammasecretase subunit Aph-1 [Blastocystis sp. subtype 4]